MWLAQRSTTDRGSRPRSLAAQIDTQLAELLDAGAAGLPLPPHDAAQLPSHPLVQPLEAGLDLRQSEVRHPTAQDVAELPDRVDEGRPRPRRNSGASLRLRVAPTPAPPYCRLPVPRDRVPRHSRSEGLATPLLSPLILAGGASRGSAPAMPSHASLLLRLHVHVAVVGVANEAVPALLQLLSSSSSRTLVSSGESGPPCGVPSARGDTTPPSTIPACKSADQKEHPLVLHPTRHARHEDVVVHAVEELLEIQVHHPAVTRRDVLAGRTIAPCALRPGRKPKLPSENVGLKIGCKTRSRAC